ncbi:MAG: hypothetical protein IK029_01430 [Oscillospiraceae bacterium]|nr:hypothetical protein [Oscillospiraceae bacterium]
MKIEGTKEACAFLEAYPKETKKIISKALRYAVNPVAKKVKSAVPYPKWQTLVRVKANESKVTGRLYAVAGMLDNGQSSVKGGITDWFKAYWMNYGTLQRRDHAHKFVRGPRGKNSRNKMGQPNPKGKAQQYYHFYDKAVDGMDVDLTNRFLKSIERQHEQLLNKIK